MVGYEGNDGALSGAGDIPALRVRDSTAASATTWLDTARYSVYSRDIPKIYARGQGGTALPWWSVFLAISCFRGGGIW